MIFLYEVAIDAHEPEHVATFWAATLRFEMIPSTPEEMEAAYEAHPGWRDKAVREDLRARHVRLYLQRVPEPKIQRNRVRFEVGLPLPA